MTNHAFRQFSDWPSDFAMTKHNFVYFNIFKVTFRMLASKTAQMPIFYCSSDEECLLI